MTRVEVMYFDGCPHARPALEAARRVGGEFDGVEVVEVQVTEADVDGVGFLGSPSIAVDGVDVEPGAGERTPHFGCRRYATDAGVVGVPPDEWIRAALQRAGAGQ